MADETITIRHYKISNDVVKSLKKQAADAECSSLQAYVELVLTNQAKQKNFIKK